MTELTRFQRDHRCGRIMVGSGTDTYDPICDLPAGHKPVCKSTAARDQHKLTAAALKAAWEGWTAPKAKRNALGTGASGPWENRSRVIREARSRGALSYPVVAAWLNQTYSVQKLEHDTHPEIVHLLIRRHDEGCDFPWRDLQMIKDRFAGQEFWAMEMFPPLDAVVDNANLRHLWVMPAGFEPPVDLREVRT